MSQQTSTKTGLKSSAKKEANTRHGTQPMPATQPTPGAFGKERSNAANDTGTETSPHNPEKPALEQRADLIDEEPV